MAAPLQANHAHSAGSYKASSRVGALNGVPLRSKIRYHSGASFTHDRRIVTLVTLCDHQGLVTSMLTELDCHATVLF